MYDLKSFAMDFGSDTTRSTQDLGVKHIHCWQADTRFSKAARLLGDYKFIDLTPFKHIETIRDYATVIAVSADRLKNKQLSKLVKSGVSYRDKSWMRLRPLRNY